MDEVFAMMDADPEMGPRLRDADVPRRLESGDVDALFPPPSETFALDEAARETGLPGELIRRIWFAAGFSTAGLERLSEDDVELLRRLAAVLHAGLPEPAFLQLVRVYGQ